METVEEPQKKVFKARKTMKASDRHQLEAVHKSKVLKSPEVKLVNGIHENGNSDMNYTHNDKVLMEDSKNLNGILDINCDALEIPVVKLSDLRDSLKHIDQTSDLKLSLDLGLTKSTVCQGDGNTVGPIEATIQTDTTQQEQDETIPHKGVEQIDSNELLEENASCEPESPEEQTQSDIPSEEENCMVSEDTSKPEDENPVENSPIRELENEDMDIISETPIDDSGNVIEESNITKEPLEPETVDSGNDVEKDDLSAEEQENEAIIDELHSELQNTEETDTNTEEQESTELVKESHDDNVSPGMNVEENGSPLADKRETSESMVEQNNFGDEAISSSMEVDHNVQNIEPISPLPAEALIDKAPSEAQMGPELENAEEMETDDIIPILEKLAPVEDKCFSEGTSDFETVPDKEEKAESITASPTKIDTSETLPSEAFLVLSDEEEPCGESTPLKESMLTDQDEVKEVIAEPKEKPADEHTGPETKDESQAEKSELSHRKRSKSEDLDSHSSKRRRFEGEEYEAELKVKITAGNDLNEKLQKVIQKMFEEKLGALQCLDFDKAIAELKSRVEKIECKKHETSLHSMQAKITRLTKRFGAAKEDLKKRSEQPAVKPPSSAVNDSSPNPNMVNIRNVGTVRQMLETKRNVTDTAPVSIQTSSVTASTSTSTQSSSSVTLRTSNTTQMPVNQSPLNNMLQSRQPPDWKLIQQKINASTIGASQNTQSSQSKSIAPVTSAPVITPVLSAPTTATVVGNSQVSTSNTQPVSVSLQSLPVILHVPQLLQGATGTLVTNQQSGNVEFIPVQNQSTVNNLAKTPVSLPVNKSMNSPSMTSSGIQRNSSTSTVNSPLAVQAMPMSHSVALSSRQSLPNVATTGMYNQASNRNTTQLKSPAPTFNSSTTEAPSVSRSDLQINRTTMTTTTTTMTVAAETASNKRSSADGSAVAGKASVIDLTLDDEDAEMSTRDSRRSNPSSVPATVQPSQPVGRQSQPVQTNTVQTSPAPAGLPPQATIHVLPTAQTTVNITQRPGTQAAPRAAAPRAPSSSHMVYTTTALPTVPVQTPVRNTAMQNQNLRQISPQTGGASVRMPQTPTYVVNNGIPIGSAGPQLTVHHRPPQEPTRPIHPAPLPEAPQPQRLPPEAASTSPPQKPHLKLARVQSQNGIVLSWSVLEVDRTCAIVDSYHLYAYHEDPTATSSSQWKKIGEVKALPLPMACTLTQFVSGSKYYFAVRAKDVYGRFGPFCDPQSTDVISTQSS
ncbi:activating transcription factor 7-interacting protein 1 isoform X1 [Ranitomeya imitator]|uniref:activating transcription factor 7-interacting protein 1 isoform X1 n=1 Tax=Ranitomeya imitator TaxID=111125 RepID=UPI0037E87780